MKAPQQKRPRRGQNPPGPPQAGGTAQDGSWDQVASWYDTLAGSRGTGFHQQVIIPAVLRLLEPQPGERVLDLGCGQGAVSRAIHEAGAQVTGVDLSPRLIQMAHRRSPGAIRYLVGDARRLDFLADASFNAIVWVLAAQNIDPVGPVFAECARLMPPGGRLVTVINHPSFRIPRQSRWGWDQERKLLFRAVDRYLNPLKISIDMRPFKKPEGTVTWSYHRPLQDYVNGLAAAGLWTNALEEWPSPRVSQPGPRAQAEDRARGEFPLFLALRSVRGPIAPTGPPGS